MATLPEIRPSSCASETSSQGDGLRFLPLLHRIPAAVSRLLTHLADERWSLKARLKDPPIGEGTTSGSGKGIE